MSKKKASPFKAKKLFKSKLFFSEVALVCHVLFFFFLHVFMKETDTFVSIF